MIKKQNFIVFILMFFMSISLAAQDIPARPVPPRLVNDFTNTLSVSQVNALEQKLVRYNDTTSTQIAVVLVNDLQGTTAADFAYRIGEKWGVGNKENNGALILVKPKNETKGEVYISIGYGLEPYIPDAIAKRIVENEMIPEFRNNDYYTGIDKAVNTIMGLASGAFSADDYSGGDAEDVLLVFFLFAMIFMIIVIRLGRRASLSSKKPDSFWKALFWAALLSNNNRHNHHDNWGGFSGGSGGFGGGGGSFGGFGGGHFGGGGAGGSW